MGVLIVNDRENTDTRTEGTKEVQIAGGCGDITQIVSEFSNLKLDQENKIENKFDTDDNNKHSNSEIKSEDLEGRFNVKVPISTSSRPLTTSFISQIASKAHGMVACDLLQVAKESFYISLCRRNKEGLTTGQIEGRTERKHTDMRERSMSEIPIGVVDSRVDPSTTVVDRSAVTTTPNTTAPVPVTAIAAASSSGSGSVVEDGAISAADDGIYRPTNLISDYEDEDEEVEEEESDSEGSNNNGETLDQIDGMSLVAPSNVLYSHPNTSNTNTTTTTTAEELPTSLQVVRTETSPKPLDTASGTDPRSDPGSGRVRPPGSDEPPVPESCGLLTEDDLQLALTRIAPSALRCVRVCVRGGSALIPISDSISILVFYLNLCYLILSYVILSHHYPSLQGSGYRGALCAVG
jgi:hypothetical protein